MSTSPPESQKYFAKMLPVDGDAVVGDDLRFIAPPQANLFLCSWDIQPGDRCMEEGRFIPFDLTRMMANCLPLDGVFKIIGAISPEAGWVKEGDEFNEEDWRPYNTKHEIVFLKDITKLYGRDTQYYPWVIQIKGPCGHFH